MDNTIIYQNPHYDVIVVFDDEKGREAYGVINRKYEVVEVIESMLPRAIYYADLLSESTVTPIAKTHAQAAERVREMLAAYGDGSSDVVPPKGKLS